MLIAAAIPSQAESSAPACLSGASPLLRLVGESPDTLEAIELDGKSHYLDFKLRYSNTSQQLFNLQNSTTGIGDVRISGFWLLRPGANDRDAALLLAGSIELPTGNVDRLQGNGAIDTSVGSYVSGLRPFGLESLRLSTGAGITRTY